MPKKRTFLICSKPLTVISYSQEAYENSFHRRDRSGVYDHRVTLPAGRYEVKRIVPTWGNLERRRCLVIKGTKNGLPETYLRQQAAALGLTIEEVLPEKTTGATPKKRKLQSAPKKPTGK